ncbi:hypothetical protein ACFL5Z_04285 [Planctomycetota bacterium]
MFERTLAIVMLGMMLLSGCQSTERNPESGDQEIVLVTPNLDDDDGDGHPDAGDEVINGLSDRNDLTAIQIPASVSEDDLRISGSGAYLYRVVEIAESPPGTGNIHFREGTIYPCHRTTRGSACSNPRCTQTDHC